MVFKKGGEIQATERWRVNGQHIEVVNKFNYLGVTLGSSGSWNKQKKFWLQALVVIDKCPSVTPNIKVQILENIYMKLYVSRGLCIELRYGD
jgi:hypothetical protein